MCPEREYTNAERCRILGAVWLVVEQDLPALSAAVNRMTTHLDPHG